MNHGDQGQENTSNTMAYKEQHREWQLFTSMLRYITIPSTIINKFPQTRLNMPHRKANQP